MKERWRARSVGLAIILAAGSVGAVVWRTASADAAPTVVVRLPDGAEVARLRLDDAAAFALRYRNSVYRSLVEERFVAHGGEMHLVELAADELAVLEEYYAIDQPARAAPTGDTRAFVAQPAAPVVLDTLTVAATDLGRRTLLVNGVAPVELWRLVDDGAASVVIEVDAP